LKISSPADVLSAREGEIGIERSVKRGVKRSVKRSVKRREIERDDFMA
jgi:hypothetical protein